MKNIRSDGNIVSDAITVCLLVFGLIALLFSSRYFEYKDSEQRTNRRMVELIERQIKYQDATEQLVLCYYNGNLACHLEWNEETGEYNMLWRSADED